MRTLAVSGMAFEAATAGEPDGELVLLLHGFPQTHHSYRHQLPALARAGYHAVAPNQRGYSAGARPAGVDAYRMELLLRDALGFADALEAERFHLVGHDWGGQLAWLLAARHPERLISLSVLSRPHPAAFAGALRSDAAQAGRSRHHGAFDDPATAERLLENDARRLRRMLRDQGVPADDCARYLAALGTRETLDAALHWYRAARRSAPELQARSVAKVSVPTLYLWGDRDATVGRAAAEATAAQVIGRYRFVELPGVGHFLTDQEPEAVTRALLEHLASARG